MATPIQQQFCSPDQREHLEYRSFVQLVSFDRVRVGLFLLKITIAPVSDKALSADDNCSFTVLIKTWKTLLLIGTILSMLGIIKTYYFASVVA